MRICARTARKRLATVLGYPDLSAAGRSRARTSRRPWRTTSPSRSSEELRLTSAGTRHFKWLVGFFYQDFESDWNLFVRHAVHRNPGHVQRCVHPVSSPRRSCRIRSSAKLSYTFCDDWTATVGARRYYYHGTVNAAVSGWLSSSGTTSFANFSTGEKDQGVDAQVQSLLPGQSGSDAVRSPPPKASVRAAATSRFRPRDRSGTSVCRTCRPSASTRAPLGFKPDKVWSYELGEKFRDERWPVHASTRPVTSRIGSTSSRTSRWRAASRSRAMRAMRISTVPSSRSTRWWYRAWSLSINGSFSHARYIANAVPDTTIDERVQNVPDVTRLRRADLSPPPHRCGGLRRPYRQQLYRLAYRRHGAGQLPAAVRLDQYPGGPRGRATGRRPCSRPT